MEAAGLALAVLPIMMTVAGYRLPSPAAIISQSRKDSKVVEYYRQLQDELALLNNTLRTLVQTLTGITEADRQRILDLESESPAIWEGNDIARALKDRLGPAHQAFLESIFEILDTMEEMLSNESFGLQRNDINVRVNEKRFH
jgi:hypothetical protein